MIIVMVHCQHPLTELICKLRMPLPPSTTLLITSFHTYLALYIHEGFYLSNILIYFDHNKDYVEMQWMMLQQEKPKDYVISSGNSES